MRKISQEASNAFWSAGNYKNNNTVVETINQPCATITHMYLHGNEIARLE